MRKRIAWLLVGIVGGTVAFNRHGTDERAATGTNRAGTRGAGDRREIEAREDRGATDAVDDPQLRGASDSARGVDGNEEPRDTSRPALNWSQPDLPVVARAQVAAKHGHWKEAVAWLDQELESLAAGRLRNRAAALRTYLLMENASPVDAGTAIAAFLASGADTMAKARFKSADAPDARGLEGNRTIFSGPFVVALPARGWPRGGDSLTRLLRDVAWDAGGREKPHVLGWRQEYIQHFSPFLQRCIDGIGSQDEPGKRRVLEAARDFSRVNARIWEDGTLGPKHAVPDNVLAASVAKFVKTYASDSNAHISAYCRFMREAFPHWAEPAIREVVQGD